MSTEVVTVYDFTVQVGSDMFCEIRKFLACHGKRDIYKFIHGASTLESKTLKQGKKVPSQRGWRQKGFRIFGSAHRLGSVC